MLYLMLLLKKKMMIYNIMDYYLPFLLLPRDRTIYIFMLLGLIPLNDIPYFISSTVLSPCLADTLISIEGQDGGYSEPNMSTSLLYNNCKNYSSIHVHL